MKRNKDFSVALLLSSYFNKRGQESLPQVLIRFGDPFPLITLYSHCQRHMKDNQPRWMKLMGLEEKKNWHAALEKTRIVTLEQKEELQNTIDLVEEYKSTLAPHEESLDDFIKKGSDMIKEGKMNITAQTYIQAIKAKADIESKNKDRRFNALREMFAGAAPKNKDM